MALASVVSLDTAVKSKQKISLKSRMVLVDSDEICPYSGKWEIHSILTTTIIIAKGQEMPRFHGQLVTWKLIEKG